MAWDAFTNNPELKIMRRILVTAYTGIICAALYVLSCRESKPGTREVFIAPQWKQALDLI